MLLPNFCHSVCYFYLLYILSFALYSSYLVSYSVFLVMIFLRWESCGNKVRVRFTLPDPTCGISPNMLLLLLLLLPRFRICGHTYNESTDFRFWIRLRFEVSCLSYLSKFWQAMIVLENSNILEILNSFICTNGCFWIVEYPFFN